MDPRTFDALIDFQNFNRGIVPSVRKVHGLGPGQSDEWYTPKVVFDALGMHFDLDVAAPVDGPLHVPCDGYIYDRSLERDWGKGKNCVWMNAPFGGRNGLAPWLDKFFDHGNGVAFVPDRTSAPWFWDAWQKADAVLFTRKLKCVRPCGSDKGSPGSGTALMGVGKKAVAGLQRAHNRGFGIIAFPQLKVA